MEEQFWDLVNEDCKQRIQAITKLITISIIIIFIKKATLLSIKYHSIIIKDHNLTYLNNFFRVM